MTTQRPLISVIIPLHNGEAFIRATLDSLAAQSVEVPEIIVVDDGSSDAGPAIVREHPLQVREIRQGNAGAAVARNVGAFAASSEYVTFLDQDDLWLPHRHERLIDLISADQREAFITTATGFVQSADIPALRAAGDMLHSGCVVVPAGTNPREACEGLPSPGPPTVLTATDLLASPPSITLTAVVRRPLFHAIGGCPVFAPAIDDYMFLLSLVAREGSVCRYDEPSVLYRVHPAAGSQRQDWDRRILTSLAAYRNGVFRGSRESGYRRERLSPFLQAHVHRLASQDLGGALAVAELHGASLADIRQAIAAALRARLRRALIGGRRTEGGGSE